MGWWLERNYENEGFIPTNHLSDTSLTNQKQDQCSHVLCLTWFYRFQLPCLFISQTKFLKLFVNIEIFGDVLDYIGEKRDEKYFKELCFQLDWIVFHLLSYSSSYSPLVALFVRWRWFYFARHHSRTVVVWWAPERKSYQTTDTTILGLKWRFWKG